MTGTIGHDPARIPTVTHRLPGLALTQHTFRLPLDYANPAGEQIAVFTREVVAAGQEGKELPWLVFFQGGPGFGSPRPMELGGWLKRALVDYRVLLLDQRGTGRSTPVLPQTLACLPSPEAQAEYLKHFRADNIVTDAEKIRHALAGPDTPWSVLGQSYGGFCVTHYLSAAPYGLQEAIITGGLPPLTRGPDDVYRATYRRVLEKNRLYFERYPEDQALAQVIVQRLAEEDVRLPDGDRLTPRRFQQLGFHFGASDGFEIVHYLLEDAFVNGSAGTEFNYVFLSAMQNTQSFDTNPIFAILHEPIYCQEAAAGWSAQRVRAEYPEFELTAGQPVLFTGEMIYPWMFEEYGTLRPLRAVAEILAAYHGWPRLYDVNTLRANRVPCVASVYYDDMYVERTFSEETARDIGGIKLWVTNEYQHNALRADGEAVLGRLVGMLRGER